MMFTGTEHFKASWREKLLPNKKKPYDRAKNPIVRLNKKLQRGF